MSATTTPTDRRIFTLEELKAMNDHDFRQAVTNDMFQVSRPMSAFQERDVVQRTLTALIDWLSWTNQKIDERAEDPNCTPEHYAKTIKYRDHLVSVIDITERRVAWIMGTKERDLRRWKAVLHEVIDAIISGKDDSEILEIKIPSFANDDKSYDLETWWEIRRAKDPSRVAAAKVAA